MKDNIPYDLVHQQHHSHQQQQHHHHHQQQQQQHHQQQQQQQQQQHQQHQQQQQQQHHHHQHQQQQQHQPQHQQQQQHSWNRHHQQHSGSMYPNQHNSHQQGSQSRSVIGTQQSQLGQYSHQQLHNNPSSAYYQQAHLYAGAFQAHAQQDQQQSAAEHHHHHLHQNSGTPVTATGTTAPALNAAVAAAAQQQHPVHNQQSANSQASAHGHAGWSPSVGALAAAQGHHTVVTDPSTLAYITHAYQSSNSSINDHRNTNAALAHQPIGSGHQPTSYAVDSIYNSPAAAAAAAVAAYGYGNYNAAFFQASNNGHHTQSGHPGASAAGISAFWNQGAQQQRAGHSQGATNQTPIQQRQQQIGHDHAAGYMQDPRLYYGRHPYGQIMQNFGQHQALSQQQQQQSDITLNRVSALTQQQLLMHHPDQQPQQFDGHQTQQLPSQPVAAVLSGQTQDQNSIDDQAVTEQAVAPVHSQPTRKPPSPARVSPHHLNQKLPSSDTDKDTQLKNSLDYDQVKGSKNTQAATQLNKSSQQSNPKVADSSDVKSTLSATAKESSKQSSVSPANKSQSVIKSNESSSHSHARKSSSNNPPQQQLRNVYRAAQDERVKSQNVDTQRKALSDRERAPLAPETKSQAPPAANKSPESDQSTLEDSMATLAISSRKTTWASIASQPAKVAQPKSLKSKISGSNSVLSSAKHLATSVAFDSSCLDPKNGINPAIKSSVSAAATSAPRASIPPPVSKVAIATATSLKLDLLGGDASDPSKISWPAVNASINLTLDDSPVKKDQPAADSTNSTSGFGDKNRRDEDTRRDRREPPFKDHNHNHGDDPKISHNYQQQRGHREERRDDFWSGRRDQRDYRVRRDSDRKEVDQEKPINHDMRNPVDQRRDFKAGMRSNQFRGDGSGYRERDFKRGAIMDRNDHRGNDNYRYPSNRYDEPRDTQSGNAPMNQNSRQGEGTPHHHYSNLREGNSSRGPQNKLDLSLHPHLNPENYNPKSFNCEPEAARYFIIKSYSEDDIHRSIKYSIWCSTNHGNKRLDEAYRQQQNKNGPLFLFFSVNSSGHFCGMAQMTSVVDFDSSSGVWAQSKWQGEFSVKWIYVKDVPNSALRHITLENNEDKPVTNSRDTQEVPSEKGKAVLKIIHQYSHNTSLFDDFLHYERRQEEEKLKKSHLDQPPAGRSDDRDRGRYGRPYQNSRVHNEFQDRPGNRERPTRYMA